MAINLSTFGLDSSENDRLAAQARAEAEDAAKQGAKKQLGAYKKGIGRQREALAPGIAAAGDYLTSQLGDYNTYKNTLSGAMGLSGQQGATDAEAAYKLSLQPGQHLSNENILRLGSQGVRSGGTLLDLQQHAFDTQYNPWREGLKWGTQQFDPYQAIGLQGTMGERLSNVEGQNASNMAGVFGNKFNALGQAGSNYYNQLGANSNAVAQNWGSLAQGLLGAGTKLAGNYFTPTKPPGTA